MKYTHLPLILLASLSLLNAGCARDVSSSTYKAGAVGEASETYQGTIVSVRQVNLKEGERLQDNSTGLAAGAIAGGVGGSMVGDGKGQLAATVGGALLGAALGAATEGQLSKQQAYEYVVKLTSGRLLTLVQGLDNPMAVGDKVFVMVSYDGRSRIVRDVSGQPQDIQPGPASTSVIKVR